MLSNYIYTETTNSLAITSHAVFVGLMSFNVLVTLQSAMRNHRFKLIYTYANSTDSNNILSNLFVSM